MMGSSKRLLAGIVGIVLLVLAGTAGILISDKNQKNISGGSGTYWSQEEGKNPGNRPGEGGKSQFREQRTKKKFCWIVPKSLLWKILP